MEEPELEILSIKTLKNRKMVYYAKNDRNALKLPHKGKMMKSRKKKELIFKEILDSLQQKNW